MAVPVSRASRCRPDDVRARTLLRSAILLLLEEQESHGYELVGRLAELGCEVTSTTGSLYRCLRAMEEEGLVSSYWSTADGGPARRVYAITKVGEEQLAQSIRSLLRLLRTLGEMLNRYQQGARGSSDR